MTFSKTHASNFDPAIMHILKARKAGAEIRGKVAASQNNAEAQGYRAHLFSDNGSGSIKPQTPQTQVDAAINRLTLLYSLSSAERTLGGFTAQSIRDAEQAVKAAVAAEAAATQQEARPLGRVVRSVRAVLGL